VNNEGEKDGSSCMRRLSSTIYLALIRLVTANMVLAKPLCLKTLPYPNIVYRNSTPPLPSTRYRDGGRGRGREI